MQAGFFAYDDDESGCTTVVFGTPSHVALGSIGCDDSEEDYLTACEAKGMVDDALDDTCDLCEDYLVSTQKSVAECKRICIAAGLTELPGLANCGWG